MPRKAINVPIPPSNELGFTGLKETGGYIREEFLKEFIGRRKYRVINEMLDNEPLIAGAHFIIRQLIKQADWKIKPASDSAEDIANAEFVESCLHDMNQSWGDVLDEILSFPAYGFSVHEIVYKVRGGPMEPSAQYRSKFTDGKIGWRKLPIRSQDSIDEWVFDEHDGLLGCIQRVENRSMTPVFLPIERILLFRTTNYKNNPEGKSIFRASYTPYYYKKRIQSLEAIGIERELNGVPVVRMPSKFMMTNASAQERAVYTSYKEMVRNIRADDQTGVVIPSDTYNGNQSSVPMYDIKLMNAQGRRGIDTAEVLGRYSREILITVMADFILLGHESIGSYALSSDKTALFSTAVAGFMKQVESVFNKHAIPRLLEVNNIRPKGLPCLKHGDIEHESIKDIADSLKAFSDAGVDINDPLILNEILTRAGIKSIDTKRKDQVSIERPKPVAPAQRGKK